MCFLWSAERWLEEDMSWKLKGAPQTDFLKITLRNRTKWSKRVRERRGEEAGEMDGGDADIKWETVNARRIIPENYRSKIGSEFSIDEDEKEVWSVLSVKAGAEKKGGNSSREKQGRTKRIPDSTSPAAQKGHWKGSKARLKFVRGHLLNGSPEKGGFSEQAEPKGKPAPNGVHTDGNRLSEKPIHAVAVLGFRAPGTARCLTPLQKFLKALLEKKDRTETAGSQKAGTPPAEKEFELTRKEKQPCRE
ncbi:hypothetical protein K438DRAFT_2102441 [Mycena galopus ATCC 62051]|nr:hypothetical protein K438DRAFT_2102441 [Mycena galopus ATCC 62051]